MHTAPTTISAAVILHYDSGKLYVTLMSTDTSKSPKWRLPAGRIENSKTSLSSLEESLRYNTGIPSSDISYREQLYTTESVYKSHTSICISYLYLSRGLSWHKGAREAQAFPVDALPKLAASDTAIITYALERLHAKALYSTILGFLLPTAFTLNDLQDIFEAATKQPVDRRNFRKKILNLDIITEQSQSGDRQGTPKRYHFRSTTLTLLSKPFTP